MNSESLESAQTTSPSTKNFRSDVHSAMADERPAKQAVRHLWLEQAQHFNRLDPKEDALLYLTLSGAEARDIKSVSE